MTGELQNIRHSIVPPELNTHQLHFNAQEYLDNRNVGIPTEIRQRVAKMSPRWNFDHWVWTGLEVGTAFLAGMLAGALITLRMMGVS